MRHQYQHARKLLVSKLPPQTLIEPTDTIIRIRGTLSIRYTIEKVSIICTLSPHTFHLRTARLKVAKILLAQTRLFVDFDL